MKTLLRIDCSSRVDDSHSRRLADFFERKWLETNPEGRVLYRDLVKVQVPHINYNTIRGFNTPPELLTEDLKEATALSNKLIEELKSVDELLISCPLYNLGIPSNLKAYIDQVVRLGYTFTIDKNGYRGLLSHIRAHLISAKGGVFKGTPMEQYNFQDPYLEAILNFMGIEMAGLFSLEGTVQEELLNNNTKALQRAISNYFISKN
jgi:FMN-dependent NADH-azoreductase